MRVLTDRRHPAEGTLRRLIDDAVGVPDADRAHVAACAGCQNELAKLERDAAAARALLHVAPAIDIDAAWQRFEHALLADQSAPSKPAAPGLRRPRTSVLASIGAAVVLSGATVAAAANWLPIFQTEQVAPLVVQPADLTSLPELDDYGVVRVEREVEVREVASAQAAADRTGLSAPVVAELPRGVSGEPEFRVGRQAVAQFTFSAAKAESTARAAGSTPPPMPPGLDGSTFRLSAGPGVMAVWSNDRGIPGLVVARAVAPAASSDGVSFDAATDYLLSLPGLPADVARQLRAFARDGSTLPVVTPASELDSTSTEVDGEPATLFASRDSAVSGVVWVDDGKITAVGGTLTGAEVLAVARGLEWQR